MRIALPCAVAKDNFPLFYGVFRGGTPKQCEEEGWGYRGREKPLP